jgi:HSP20 family protein
MVEPKKTVAVTTEAKSEAKAPAPAAARARSPVANLRAEIDRLFDEFSFPLSRFPFAGGLFEPSRLWQSTLGVSDLAAVVDIVEKDKGFQLTTELAGMDPANVAVSVSGDVLTIQGEKKEEEAETKKGYHVSERRFGMFERSFDLPASVDQSRIEANIAKGVLTVTLPKTTEAQKQERRIEIKAK